MPAALLTHPVFRTEILSKEAAHISVPHYEKLTLETIREFCQQHENEIDRYLPDSRELHKVSRQWICNIIASVLGTTFTDWVRNIIEERNDEVTEKKGLEIELDQDIFAAFQMSTAVSRKCRTSITHSPSFPL